MASRFRKTVLGIPELASGYRNGLRALAEADAARITCSNSRKITGSVNVDARLERLFPNEPRWDYVIGQSRYRSDCVHWVEVHPCKASEVKVVIKKLKWLKAWVGSHGTGFRDMDQRYVWIPAGQVSLPSTSPQYRQAMQEGMRISPRRCVLF